MGNDGEDGPEDGTPGPVSDTGAEATQRATTLLGSGTLAAIVALAGAGILLWRRRRA